VDSRSAVKLGRGHTLAATLDQATSVSGAAPQRIYVDKGYRGYDYTDAGEMMIAGRGPWTAAHLSQSSCPMLVLPQPAMILCPALANSKSSAHPQAASALARKGKLSSMR
jgi:hypothetical protein